MSTNHTRTLARARFCGTTTGYREHHKNREPTCDPCRTAQADAKRRRHACECGKWKKSATDLTCRTCEKTDVPLTGGAWVPNGLTQVWVAA